MNKRQELIDELIKADQDGTYKTYKSKEEIKAMNNEVYIPTWKTIYQTKEHT